MWSGALSEVEMLHDDKERYKEEIEKCINEIEKYEKLKEEIEKIEELENEIDRYSKRKELYEEKLKEVNNEIDKLHIHEEV